MKVDIKIEKAADTEKILVLPEIVEYLGNPALKRKILRKNIKRASNVLNINKC